MLCLSPAPAPSLVNSAATHKYYHDIMFPVWGSARCAIYLLHEAHGLLGSYSQSWTQSVVGCRSDVCKHMPPIFWSLTEYYSHSKKYLPIIFLKQIPGNTQGNMPRYNVFPAVMTPMCESTWCNLSFCFYWNRILIILISTNPSVSQSVHSPRHCRDNG